VFIIYLKITVHVHLHKIKKPGETIKSLRNNKVYLTALLNTEFKRDAQRSDCFAATLGKHPSSKFKAQFLLNAIAFTSS
jgi:hypothetical protein